MAKIVLTDAQITLGGQDLSNHVETVTLDYKGEPQDNTAFGATTRTVQGGLLNWTVSLQFYADEAASEVQVTLFPLVNTVLAMIIRPVAGSALSVTNPDYTGDAFLESMGLVSGTVGSMHMTPVSLVAAGVLTRVTSA